MKPSELKKYIEESKPTVDSAGYARVYCPGHPNSYGCGNVFLHRAVVEYHLDRFLTSSDHIHHKNGNKLDNRIENLQLTTPSEHAMITWCETRGIDPSTYEPPAEKRCGCGKKIYKTSHTCQECQPVRTKIDWPDSDSLKKMVQETNFTQVGKVLGVSDNAIRKRLKNHP